MIHLEKMRTYRGAVCHPPLWRSPFVTSETLRGLLPEQNAYCARCPATVLSEASFSRFWELLEDYKVPEPGSHPERAR